MPRVALENREGALTGVAYGNSCVQVFDSARSCDACVAAKSNDYPIPGASCDALRKLGCWSSKLGAAPTSWRHIYCRALLWKVRNMSRLYDLGKRVMGLLKAMKTTVQIVPSTEKSGIHQSIDTIVAANRLPSTAFRTCAKTD